jgi:uncharacterized protein (UPF0332 family)
MNATEALLGRAQQALTSARVLLETNDANGAISRAYYAMFYAAEAALLRKGVEASTHAGVLAMFGEHLVRRRSLLRSMAATSSARSRSDR